MSADELDISRSLTWQDGLPVPPWDLIRTWAESRREPGARRDALAAVAGQWLAELGRALGGGYETVESRNFLALAPETQGIGRLLLPFAERCRAALRSILGEVADFDAFGKPVVVVLKNWQDYYRYISLYYPEGEHGASAGVHIRDGYPHVALHRSLLLEMENALAHELVHVALHHLSMPQWVEEGLAQMFQHDMTGSWMYVDREFRVNPEMAERHKQYWQSQGLKAFWSGEGFGMPGQAQRLSYELAQILVRLLVDDSRPRWFGRVREPQRRFFAFLRAASEADCGEAASREHLGFGLSELAARFLGPGSWSPSPDPAIAKATRRSLGSPRNCYNPLRSCQLHERTFLRSQTAAFLDSVGLLLLRTVLECAPDRDRAHPRRRLRWHARHAFSLGCRGAGPAVGADPG